MKPFFTIIIATFNSEKVLGNALESIANQTYMDYEVYVIDKLSTDGTMDIAMFYTKVIPTLKIVSEDDHGIYDAINKGIERSKGEWIYNLGSDDTLFSPTILADVKHYLEQTQKMFAYGSIRVMEKTDFFKKNQIYAGEMTAGRLLVQGISQQSTFYKRDLFDTLGMFNTRYRIWADWEFALKAFKANENYYIPLIVANFAIGGISSRERDKVFISDNVVQKYRA